MALAAEVRGERWRRAADSGSRTAGNRDGRAGKAQSASRDDNRQGGMSGGRGAAKGRNGMSGESARGALAKGSGQDANSDGIAADSGSRTAGSGDGRAGKAQAASTDDNEQGGMSGGRGAAAERNGIGDNGRGTAFSKKRTTKQAFFPSSIIFQGRHTRK